MLGPSWLQVGSSWPMLAPSWLTLKTIHAVACPTSRNPPCGGMPHPSKLASSRLHVGSMLAHVSSMLAHVGPSGLQDGPTWLQVGPSWPQDAIMLAQVGLKMSQMASNSEFCSNVDQKMIKKWSLLKHTRQETYFMWPRQHHHFSQPSGSESSSTEYLRRTPWSSSTPIGRDLNIFRASSVFGLAGLNK